MLTQAETLWSYNERLDANIFKSAELISQLTLKEKQKTTY